MNKVNIMNAYESISRVWKRMKVYLERSHLKWHTFGRDRAIYIKQPAGALKSMFEFLPRFDRCTAAT